MASAPLGVDDPEDLKILTLARATRARTRAAEGASVRDRDGRTYAASTVDLPSLQLSALSLAVAMAVSSGATGLEAVAVSTDADGVRDEDLAVVRDLAGSGVPVLVADAQGSAQRVVQS
ncbi:cytidine deaminase [Mumia sp. zg.B53]|uniref:cytidine deaminase n=1 Tax=unclassified Mumia TaxID=2621872 RepID=UPI001C6DD641|nr:MULTISPECIES: cytidine deaminase [unclassified Mumia]MBW9206433.1 cytidine deaminase [Mumia sp. zg.B17]MBW9211277.1 cytidine deaminase [Mumia sp. zg.B21]MBW9215852.1 cytidine deaminase [Mumia sp. zg.B53]MDD9349791.1 cytidine deaminase [Mumia sp.]